MGTTSPAQRTESPLWREEVLPDGKVRIVLRRVVRRWELGMYGAISAGMVIASFLVADAMVPLAIFLFLLGTTVAIHLAHLWYRRESWLLSPALAERTVRGLGRPQTERLVDVSAVLTHPETDSDDRALLKIEVLHRAGRTTVGFDNFDRDEQSLALAKTLARLLKVELREEAK